MKDDGRPCRNPVLPNRKACADHACHFGNCERTAGELLTGVQRVPCVAVLCHAGEMLRPFPVRRKLPAPQVFCPDHACKQCIVLGRVSPLAEDDPPRNVCSEHALCYQCDEFAIPGKDVCAKHDVKQCQYTSWWGGWGCYNAAIYGHSYCADHLRYFSYYDGGTQSVEARDQQSDGASLTTKLNSTCELASLFCK